MGRKLNQVKQELMADEEFRREYAALGRNSHCCAVDRGPGEGEPDAGAGGRRMGTTQSVVARLESGHPLPSLRTLKKYASAVGTRVEIRLVGKQVDAVHQSAEAYGSDGN